MEKIGLVIMIGALYFIKVISFSIELFKKNKMKTNELRIGNYVMYADVICKVEGYSRGFLETNGVNSLISAFQPIPLSEDWLFKLGFEETYRSEFTIKLELKESQEVGFKWNQNFGWNFYYKCQMIELTIKE